MSEANITTSVTLTRVYDAAFGCAYPPAPQGTHIITVSHDTIKIRCNVSRESWTLKCEPAAQQWTGTTGNCTAGTFFIYSYSLCACVMSLY